MASFRALVGRSLCLAGVVGVMAMGTAGRAEEKADYPVPAPAKDPQNLGQHIQRTMTLLATSTPQHRNHVRILFYGQSITEQEWSKQVADELRRRYPYADLEVENRAIGGFASQLLIRPAEYDLYPFYPDLLIFHVYGANQEYEEIIRNVRSRTTAEVLMQRDHVTAWPPAVQDPAKDKGEWWTDFMNNQFLPTTAKKYGCGLDDVRGGWLDYLKSNGQEPKALLKDGVHLNAWGNFLMAQLVERYLVYRPELPKSEWEGLVRSVAVGKEAKWKDGKLTLEFEGNRVDLLPGTNPGPNHLSVTIDGKKPSERSEVYANTRPQPGPWSPLFIKRVEHNTPLQAETWSYKVTSVGADSKVWSFDVVGSVTGPDGSGTSDKPFVSKSGRVKIAPSDYFANGTLPVGYTLTWKSYVQGLDNYIAGPASLDPTRENAVTLAQGLANGHHTLVLTTEGRLLPPPIRALRVYKPPVAETKQP